MKDQLHFNGTPGEWKVGQGEVFRPASTGSISPYYQRVCSFVNAGPESIANAKLIAAAPEMLAFIQEMAQRYANSQWIADEANKLIKKAIQ